MLAELECKRFSGCVSIFILPGKDGIGPPGGYRHTLSAPTQVDSHETDQIS